MEKLRLRNIKIIYGLILVASIIMLMQNFYFSVEISSYDDASMGMADGFKGTAYLSLVKLIVSIVLIVSTMVLTLDKGNTIKAKYIILIGLIILQLFIPIGYEAYSGGIAGISGKNNIYLWNLLTYIF